MQPSRRSDMSATPRRFVLYYYGQESRCSSRAVFWPCCLPSLIASTVARSDTEGCLVVSAGVAVFGLTTIAAGALRDLLPLAGVLLIGGGAWISFISLFNVQVLNQT